MQYSIIVSKVQCIISAVSTLYIFSSFISLVNINKLLVKIFSIIFFIIWVIITTYNTQHKMSPNATKTSSRVYKLCRVCNLQGKKGNPLVICITCFKHVHISNSCSTNLQKSIYYYCRKETILMQYVQSVKTHVQILNSSHHTNH